MTYADFIKHDIARINTKTEEEKEQLARNYSILLARASKSGDVTSTVYYKEVLTGIQK